MPHATLTINLSALTANYLLLQAHLGGVMCGAVVKANAYGLGMKEVATALFQAGCRVFFVATLEEGIALRQLLDTAKIYVFHGVIEGEEIAFRHYRLVPVLNSLQQLACWNNYARNLKEKQNAALHIDTGMCRLGLSQADLMLLAEDQSALEAVKLEYVISHLACADEQEHPKNRQQLKLFEAMPSFLRAIPRSFSNSSGIFLGEAYHFNLARPGAALYGINPTPSLANPMQGVVNLSARILQVRDVDFPETVGYGASYKAVPGMRIAVIPMGYADGYSRMLGNRGYCFMNGIKLPVIGRVSMDMITVDVTSVQPEALYPGAEIEMIGVHCTIDEVAAQAETIGYEVLTGLGKRYKRVYV